MPGGCGDQAIHSTTRSIAKRRGLQSCAGPKRPDHRVKVGPTGVGNSFPSAAPRRGPQHSSRDPVGPQPPRPVRFFSILNPISCGPSPLDAARGEVSRSSAVIGPDAPARSSRRQLGIYARGGALAQQSRLLSHGSEAAAVVSDCFNPVRSKSDVLYTPSK